MRTYAEYLKSSAVKKEVIDLFLDLDKKGCGLFDSELGYTHADYIGRDGMDNSNFMASYSKNGMRALKNYADKPCRINTYGDSFTNCDQVNDGETWQEYLAAHLREPVRNFGVSGYGVLQAYRRMLRAEKSADGAEYIIFYIWGDDHCRSLLRCRNALSWFDGRDNSEYHYNFWSNIEMDLESGKFLEKASICPTAESLYRMCSPGFMYEALHDDLMLQMEVFLRFDSICDVLDMKKIRRLADVLNIPVKEGNRGDLMESVYSLRNKYSFAATEYILERCREYTERNGKKLLVALFDPSVTRQLIQTGTRYDQEIVDFLNNRHYRYFDMNLVHAEEFKSFNFSLEDYLKRYLIGHYNPKGNHLFAFSIKDHIIGMLEPKPIAYRSYDETLMNL